MLIGLNDNPSAQKLQKVFFVATAMGAKITLLHVIADTLCYAAIGRVTIMGFAGHLDTSETVPDEVIQPDELSRQFLNKAKLHLGDDSIQIQTMEGDSAECILTVAKAIRADVIVMGSHSRKWFENTVMGSVAERVLRYTTVPVLIIPTKK